jgi:hypothetical protein
MRWLACSRSDLSITISTRPLSRPFHVLLIHQLLGSVSTSATSNNLHFKSTSPRLARLKNPTMPSQLDNRRASELRASLSAVGSTLDAELRPRITTIHSNSAALASQQADLTKQTAKLQKESAQWQKVADNSRGKLKELGDFENGAEMLERDMQVR